MPWFDRLDGIGRVRVYDFGPRTIDRYSVLFEDDPDPERGGPVRPYGPRGALALSATPDGPLGFSQYVSAVPGPHLGRRIAFGELPENVQHHARTRMAPE